MKTIEVTLHKNRSSPGALALFAEAGGELLHDCDALGKADNEKAIEKGNVTRDPVRPYGDTPTGTYKPAKVFTFNPPHARMGPYAIPLLGMEGQCADACRRDTTTGKPIRIDLFIHAGRGNDRLIPTYGCIRVRDDDMLMLKGLIGDDDVQVIVKEDG